MKRLLLVGGGQSHVFVLRALAAAPRRDIEVVLITPTDRLLYSGMLPGWIAGHYALPDLTIPLGPLAQAAGAILLPRRVVGLDLQAKTVLTQRGESIEFDLLSIGTGPAVDFDAIPGTRDFALPIRPLENFVEGWNRIHEHALAPFLEETGKDRLAEVERVSAHVELSLTELLQRADEEIGRAAADVEQKAAGAEGRLAQAETRHADGCVLNTTALPPESMPIELLRIVSVGLVVGVMAPMTPQGAHSVSVNPSSPE